MNTAQCMKRQRYDNTYGEHAVLHSYPVYCRSRTDPILPPRPFGLMAFVIASFVLFIACASGPSSSATVETVAGTTAVRGATDGPVQDALFSRPEGLAVGPDGSLYVVEPLQGRIRKVNTDGVVTTIVDEETSDVDLRLPSRIAVGLGGNLYVTDAGNNRVVKIDAEGNVATVTGTGERGYVDGPIAEAQFIFPIGISVATDGTVYVADSGNARVRKITPDGVVTTVAGSGEKGFKDGPAAEAQFKGLNELAVDSTGNIYVTEADGERVRKISPDGIVTTAAGSGERGFADGDVTKAKFNGPAGIAVDAAGNLYVAEFLNNRIRKIVQGEQVSTIAGTDAAGSKDGTADEAQFNAPYGITVDAQGAIYVADSGNHVIRKLEP